MVVAAQPVAHPVAGYDVVHLLRWCPAAGAAARRSQMSYPSSVAPRMIGHVEIATPPCRLTEPLDRTTEPAKPPGKRAATRGAAGAVRAPLLAGAYHNG